MSCKGYDFRFPLTADIYYAKHTMNDINQMEVEWVLEHEFEPCEIRSDKFNSDVRYAISADKDFANVPLLIFGRFKNDIRKGNDGRYVAPTSIMVTNVRDYCTQTPLFLETSESIDVEGSMSTLFELRTFQPFINPWGKIEYYKTQVYRMEDQLGTAIVK